MFLIDSDRINQSFYTNMLHENILIIINTSRKMFIGKVENKSWPQCVGMKGDAAKHTIES